MEKNDTQYTSRPWRCMRLTHPVCFHLSMCVCVCWFFFFFLFPPRRRSLFSFTSQLRLNFKPFKHLIRVILYSSSPSYIPQQKAHNFLPCTTNTKQKIKKPKTLVFLLSESLCKRIWQRWYSPFFGFVVLRHINVDVIAAGQSPAVGV